MEELGRYQKGLLLLLLIMAVIFSVVYFSLSSQMGFVYNHGFLKKSVEGGNTLYSGKIGQEAVVFAVGADKSLTYRHGDKTYGPFTVREDPTAVPKSNGRAEDMTGVEIKEGEEILFRGGVLDDSMYGMILVEEKTGESNYGGDGAGFDSFGNMLGDKKPSVHTILRILSGPELSRRVNWGAWFGGLVVAVLTALGILFADAFFRFRMSFRVEYVDDLSPSAWEIMSRYIAWTVGVIATLYIFFSGLTL